MHVHTRTPTYPPSFFGISPPIFLILLFLSLFRTLPFLRSSSQFSRFLSLCISISSPSLTSLDQVSRTKLCGGGERRKKAGGVKLPPSSEKRAHQHHHHYHHHYHRSQSLLRSRASIIGELAIYAWSIPPCLTRLLLRAPSPFSPLSLSCSYCPFPFFLFLRPPPLLSLSHLTL